MANHKISANNPDLLDLNQLLSDDNLKEPKKVLKALFPNLSEDQYSAVAEMSVAIILPRQRQHLGKALKWRPQRTANGYQSLDEKEIALFLQAIKELSASMPKEWNKISADEISLDWKRASSDDLPNSELWRNSLVGRGLFEAPHFTENDGFSLEVFPAVVNPDNPDQVWSIGSSIALSDISSGKITQKDWDNYLRQNKEQLEKEFGFEKDPRVLKPHVRLFWRITAPDGETFTLPRAEKEEWRQNANAKSWVHDRKVKIEEAYQKAAMWAVYEAMYSARIQTPETSPNYLIEKKAEIQQQKLTDVLDKNFKMLDFDWDLFDQKAPNNLEEFDAMMQEMEVTNPQGLEKIKTYMTSVAPSVLYDKKGWATKRWLFANEFRDQISARPFLNDEDIEDFMSSEQRFFVEEASKRDVLDYVSSLKDEEKLKFLDILYWNDCNVPEPVLNALTNNQVEEVVVAEQSQTAVKKIAQNKHSRVDWKPLLEAFDVDPNTTDLEANPFENHPFANWMMRLNPPKEVIEPTLAWIEENEVFNDVNRLILHKKDKDESALNLELIEKLNKVISTSNEIIEDSRQSGGWWGRVRKNMTSQSTVTSEQWADAYMEFQNHMVGMLEDINKQVERDKTWLRYADGIKSSSKKVDAKWQQWLTDTAKRLSEERENLKDNVTSERKIEWNNEATALESAQSAYEHIKIANSVGHILLEKVRQSVGVKERLQQRTMLFYWSSLNMFAGLQTLQRNTNSIGEQSEFVEEMGKVFQGGLTRSLKEEAEQKEKIREAFKNMAQSEAGMKQFYETIATFQKDTVAIISDLAEQRGELQEQTAEVVTMSSAQVKKKLKSQQMEIEAPKNDPAPKSRSSSSGPR